MGFSFRKSFKVGPFRTTLTHRGITNSIGAGGVRYSKSTRYTDVGSRRSRIGNLDNNAVTETEGNDNQAAASEGNPVVGFIILAVIAYVIYLWVF
ncbi:hypothetical protein J2Z31_001818 [Sinorhizobium kostiense]|uniref:DUF4236 domain-containing protein n=1 Tax=Sinorhizobium kostiense TaxID=76747 RepID=A0ABS4QXE8_9HYPH|nr:DUF4236 domain-containing protein [Sinorhizobium kostiense]MBP2235326.1 hypothetical protein [Sinorhizobium kostiense]